MADLCVRRGIDGGGGVVQDQDAGLFQQCAGNAEALLLAAGDVVAALLDVGLVLVGEALDKFIGAGLLAGDVYKRQPSGRSSFPQCSH